MKSVKKFKNQLVSQETEKKKKSWNLKKKKRVKLTPTFARKKRGNTILSKESNQVQSSEAGVQWSKGCSNGGNEERSIEAKK